MVVEGNDISAVRESKQGEETNDYESTMDEKVPVKE